MRKPKRKPKPDPRAWPKMRRTQQRPLPSQLVTPSPTPPLKPPWRPAWIGEVAKPLAWGARLWWLLGGAAINLFILALALAFLLTLTSLMYRVVNH